MNNYGVAPRGSISDGNGGEAAFRNSSFFIPHSSLKAAASCRLWYSVVIFTIKLIDKVPDMCFNILNKIYAPEALLSREVEGPALRILGNRSKDQGANSGR